MMSQWSLKVFVCLGATSGDVSVKHLVQCLHVGLRAPAQGSPSAPSARHSHVLGKGDFSLSLCKALLLSKSPLLGGFF